MLIKGGFVFDPANARAGRFDIRIAGGKIVAVGHELGLEPGEEVLDAAGLVVAPGFVDIHVHLRDPGFTHKETLASGSRAAAAGGFTTVVAMANTKPVMDRPELVREFYRRAAREAAVNVYTVGAVTRGLAGEELSDFAALKEAGVVGFSDDGNPIPTAALMRQALEEAGRLGLPVIAHEGDLSLVADTIVNEGMPAASLGFRGMPVAAEDIQVARDVLLAELTGARVHIQHVSSARSVAIIREAKARGVRVTAEATPHHFTLTDEALLEWGADAKMNPPLRSAADVAAVRQGLADGTLDAIATDHAPHAPEEKAAGLAQAPCGIIGLETAFGLTWTELVQTGVLTPSQAIAKLTYLPARILDLPKGTLNPGSDADITIFDPNATWEVEPHRFFSQSRNTPFAGRKLTGRIVYTVVGGRLVYAGGKILTEEASA
ncbi:MAG: dihydroorotase [Bacillota bacterium]|jgi:dihydroorotase|nr:dihydroorotase [Bacillota bacterium]MDK2785138.1 dihydroorotase [Bacillota bacterium]MDK2883392.1 dihydroorotase [Bacillota bacterium]